MARPQHLAALRAHGACQSTAAAFRAGGGGRMAPGGCRPHGRPTGKCPSAARAAVTEPPAPLRMSLARQRAHQGLAAASQDSGAYRKQGQVWLEGDHLCRAALDAGLVPAVAVFQQSFWPLARVALRNCGGRV
jgi:hypothetical protein